MRCGYLHALALNVAIMFTGAAAGYVYHHTAGILGIVEAIVESPMFRMAEARVEAVESAVQIAAEAASGGDRAGEPGTEILLLSTAMGILFTNLTTCLGAALAPLIPLLYFRMLRLRERGEEVWRSIRYAAPIVPVAVTWFNGLVFYVVSAAETVYAFMPLEGAALLMLSSKGLEAALNSKTPEMLEKSYDGMGRIAFPATLLLLAAAFMESAVINWGV